MTHFESPPDLQPDSKPNRLRRTVRALVLIVGIILVLLFVASRFAEPWLRHTLVGAAQDKAGTDLELDRLLITWKPFGIRVDRPSMTLEGEDAPYAAAERISALVDVGGLLHGKMHIDQVIVEQPRLVLRVREDGSLALPTFEGDGGGGNFEIGSLELRGGEIEWNDNRVPMTAELNGLAATTASEEDGTSVASFTADGLATEIRGQQVLFGVDGEIAWKGSEVEIRDIRGQGEQLDWRVAGSWALGSREQGSGDFVVDAEGDLGFLQPWLVDSQSRSAGDSEALALVGHTRLNARIHNTDPSSLDSRAEPSWVVEGQGQIDGLLAGGFHLDSVPLVFALRDQQLSASSQPIAAYGGQWSAEMEVGEGQDRVSLSGQGADLQKLADDLGWTALATGGVLNTEIDYRFDSTDWQSGSGDATLQLFSGDQWTLAGTIPVKIGPNLGLTFGGRLASVGALAEDGATKTAVPSLAADGQSHSVAIEGDIQALDSQGNLRLLVETADLVALQEQIGLRGDWVPTAGRGTVEVAIDLNPQPESMAMTVNADLTRAELASLSADTATVSLTMGEHGLVLHQAEMHRGEARLMASGSFPVAPEVTSISAHTSDWPLRQLLPLAGLDFDLDGVATGNMELQIAEAAVDGSIELAVKQPEWNDTALGGTIEASIEIADSGVVVDRGRWTSPGGEVDFNLRYQQAEGWNADLMSEALDLAAVNPALAAVPFGYQASFDINVRGDDWIDAGEILLTTGFVDGESSTLNAQLRDQELSASGAVAGVLKQVSASGSFGQQGPQLDFSGVIYPGSWVQVPELEVTGSARVDVNVSGSWQQPLAVAQATEVAVVVAGEVLGEIEPIQATWRPGEIELVSAFVENQGTGEELFVAGTVDLETGVLDGVMQAEVDALWLGRMEPSLEAEGGVSFLGVVEGSLEAPVVDGQGEWSGGKVSIDGFPHTLTDVSARFLVGPEGVIVDRAQANLGGGQMHASGSIDLDPATGVSYRAQIVATGVDVNVPDDWWMGGDATLRLHSNGSSRVLSGEVQLDRAVLLESIDLGVEQMVRSALQRQREWVASEDELLRSTHLQLTVVGQDALRVSGEGLDMAGDIDLTVRGDLASPLILGRVDLATGGSLTYRGNDFDIERGVLVFSNPHVINPDIDIVAVSPIKNYDVRLHLRGSLETMDVEFSSDPSLPSLEVVSLLTTGQIGNRPLLLDPINPTESAAAEGVIAGQAAEAIGARVGKLFGLDRVQIDPPSSGPISSARITVGKRLSREVVATYSYDYTDSEPTIVQLEWQMSPIVAVVLTQNGDESYSVDFKWQRSF